jgi:hypothetical protein
VEERKARIICLMGVINQYVYPAKMEKSNKEMFGGRRPNRCTLNKQRANIKR